MTNEYAKKWDRKAIKANAKARLSQNGVLLPLIFAIFMCCLVWMAVEICEAFVYFFALSLFSSLADSLIFQYAIMLSFDAASILLTAPIFMGVYRLASMLSSGEHPHLTEIFYYFSPGKYGRALAGFAISALPVLIYRAIFAELFSALAASIENSKVDTFAVIIAVLFFILLLILAVGGGVALFLPYSRLYSVIAAIVNGEGQPLGLCIRAGLRATKGKTGAIFAFRASFVLWVLLSTATIGMLLIIFTVPYMLVSYFYYNAVLFGKEPKPVTSTEVTFDER